MAKAQFNNDQSVEQCATPATLGEFLNDCPALASDCASPTDVASQAMFIDDSGTSELPCCDPRFLDQWFAYNSEHWSTVHAVFTPGLDAAGTFAAPAAGGNLVLQPGSGMTSALPNPAYNRLRFFSHGFVSGISQQPSVPQTVFLASSQNALFGDNLSTVQSFTHTNAYQQREGGDPHLAALVAKEYYDFIATALSIEVEPIYLMDPSTGNQITRYTDSIFEGDASYEERLTKSVLDRLELVLTISNGTNHRDYELGPLAYWISQSAPFGSKSYTRGQPFPGTARKLAVAVPMNRFPKVTLDDPGATFTIRMPGENNGGVVNNVVVPNKTTVPTLAANYYVPIKMRLYGINYCMSSKGKKGWCSTRR
jgi:hypothetical protein